MQGEEPHVTPAEIGLRLVAALWRFWWLRGRFSEGRAWCEIVLARAGTERTDRAFLRLRAQALNSAGILATYQSDHLTGMGFLEQTLAIWRALGNQEGVAATLNNLGMVAYNAGDDERAARYYEECLTLSRASQDLWGLASTLNNCGLVALRMGSYAQAAAYHDESLAIRRRLGDTWGIAASLSNLGSLAYHRGDYEAARRLYVESLPLVLQLGDRVSASDALLGLARVARVQGQPERAARLFGAVDALLEATSTSRETILDGRYDDEVAALQAVLPDTMWAAETANGRQMPLEETIVFASTT
jgi:tetratricopeptide (TPR) repeat protein